MLSRLFPTKRWWGALLFVFVSSLLFASAHWEGGIWAISESTMWGLAAAVLYLASGNLWPLIFAHVVVDWTYFV
jgi:membrane protease YdiL (CAAX protease family)